MSAPPISNPHSPISPLLRPDIARMEEYTPVQPFEVLSARMGRRPEEIVKLDANENPYGPSPRLRQALTEFPWYHIYPDPQQTSLRAALSHYTGVPADTILPGHGADELLDYLCRLFLTPGDAILSCPPTFGMYSFDAKLSGGRVVDVWRREDFSLDVEGIEQAALGSAPRPKLLFLTSPNNPDGSLIPHEALRRLLRLPLVVVVDEAYIEFAADGQSVATWVPGAPNLVVLRTFSKWAGLAGLRLGYGIFPLAIIQHLWKFKQPYNVNVAATVAGLTSLDDLPYLRTRIEALKIERDRLIAELGRFPYLRPYPSQANFVLCRVEGRPAADLHRRLAEQGVLVRYYDKPGLQNCIRVSAGRPQDTERLLGALEVINHV
ncbi:MAG: histidinol-phosphate transaminase [Caldilineales bacterium]|nr:histidinol-phosphate transaminase [Caldilineales bacterium]MCW5859096.1 histidinol-phosphate transaminase [Caldilineales bacterium]